MVNTESRHGDALAELEWLGCEFGIERGPRGIELDVSHGPHAVLSHASHLEADNLRDLGEKIWDALAAAYDDVGDDLVPVGPSKHIGEAVTEGQCLDLSDLLGAALRGEVA